jgi:hypothetical protein
MKAAEKRAFKDTKCEDTKCEDAEKRARLKCYVCDATLYNSDILLTKATENLIEAKLRASNRPKEKYTEKEKEKQKEERTLIKKIRDDLLVIKEEIVYKKNSAKEIAITEMSRTQVTAPALAMSLTRAIALLTPPTEAHASINRLNDAERMRSINLHLELLLHTEICLRDKSACTSQNCKKMKDFLSHGETCDTKADCKLCYRINKLLKLHSDRCNLDRCNVRGCRRNIAHV